MKVSPSEPFKIIYSILNHEYLGYIFESFVVQLDSQGDFTFQIQNISSKNVDEFKSQLDKSDFELVKLIDNIQQDVILKKYNPKKLSPVDFFLKIYDPQKGDKGIQERISAYLEECKAQILNLLEEKALFVMGSDGNPLWKPIIWEREKAKIRFHLMRNENNTHYFPTIIHQSKKLEFQYKNAILICEEPAWLVVEGHLYHFEGNLDGKKIKPFLAKKFIAIPSNMEEQYYKKFVAPLIAAHDVVAKGFEIKQISSAPVTILKISEYNRSPKVVSALFDEQGDEGTQENESDDVLMDVHFQYGDFQLKYDASTANTSVEMHKNGSDYQFFKVNRHTGFEKKSIAKLNEWGLDLTSGRILLSKNEAFGWLQSNARQLEEAGIIITQKAGDGKRYFLGYSSIDVSIKEERDWFDIKARVVFGEFEIPFIQLRSYILNGKKEFTLPNGEIAVIPEWWFTKYSELFSFTEPDDSGDELRIHLHHIALVQELQEENLATAIISRKLEGLRDFEKIAAYDIPSEFKGELRPYQKAGYNWLRFLNQYRLGGCLADDMGLGKTIQTLALLLSEKEAGIKAPSLLILPTSLLYNWVLEAGKFTPDIKILLYTGTYRDKDAEQFDQYDLIITSYGIVRLDIELIQSYRFNYVILDESQAIKNPSSIITKAVRRLNSAHRLILTGTPVENSTMDLWSQISFINPGLLGSQTFFRDEFQIPIERKNDEDKSRRLYNLIKPFILRRNKMQVAKDLPEKVENVQYCDMSEDQEKVYEEAKAFYRNKILESIDTDGMSKSHMVVLQGLTKLRQIANHPKMVDPEYVHDSGKFKDVIHKLDTVISEDHKILIFSQYIKHLDLFRSVLDERGVVYAYLDGSTKDRQKEVESFQENSDIRIFLISLKAGGLGLNLTAADYVFILDPWWNPAIEAQAVDRAHRIGQDRTVFTYKFITKNTVEEKILALQRTKKQLADDLISSEDGFVKSLTRDDIMQLMS